MPTRFLTPLTRAQAGEIEHLLAAHEARSGFAPNSYLIWGKNPTVLKAWGEIHAATRDSDTLPPLTRGLISFVASAEAGCVYCMTHIGATLVMGGHGAAVLRSVLLDLEATPAIDEPTRAALRMARDAASPPNRVTAWHFEQLRRYYSDDQIVEIVFQTAHFGFLYRLNAMFGTELEPVPYAFGVEQLAPSGWRPGVHQPPDSEPLPPAPPLSLPKPPLPDAEGPRLEPLSRGQVPELEDVFAGLAARLGFVPNSVLIMARRPQLVRAMDSFWTAVRETSTLPRDLASMAAYMASATAGCQYCEAHTSLSARDAGAPQRTIEALARFETSPLFTDAERAALRYAVAGASQPTGMNQAIADELLRHFDQRQVVDLTFVIAVFGFLNRWNDSFATPLEDLPFAFAQDHLTSGGWSGDKHRVPAEGRRPRSG